MNGPASSEITRPSFLDTILRVVCHVEILIFLNITALSIPIVASQATGAESEAFVRIVAGAGEQLGALRPDADGTDAVALPGAKFVSDAEFVQNIQQKMAQSVQSR